jgi:hypothetical protein
MAYTTDPARHALVAVGVHNDFCPGRALPVPEGHRVARTRHFKDGGGAWPPHRVPRWEPSRKPGTAAR